jgi:acetyl-CoA carboxylase biotin carboxyl carrier protein
MQVKIEALGQVQSILSPTVGKAVIEVDDEALLSAGDRIGYLESIHQKYPLEMPDSLEGVWQIKGVKKTPYLLEYHSEIAKIYPFRSGRHQEDLETTQSIDEHGQHGQQDNANRFKRYESAMDGTFYRKSSPEAPVFIEEGMTVEPKQVIALIEVMKCFYQLHFEGKTRVKIEQIVVKDGQSIQAGDLLFYYSI